MSTTNLKAKVQIFQKIDLAQIPLDDLWCDIQLNLESSLLDVNTRGELRLLLIEVNRMRQNLTQAKIRLSGYEDGTCDHSGSRIK